jgi:hypothetical protein
MEHRADVEESHDVLAAVHQHRGIIVGDDTTEGALGGGGHVQAC